MNTVNSLPQSRSDKHCNKPIPRTASTSDSTLPAHTRATKKLLHTRFIDPPVLRGIGLGPVVIGGGLSSRSLVVDMCVSVGVCDLTSSFVVIGGDLSSRSLIVDMCVGVCDLTSSLEGLRRRSSAGVELVFVRVTSCAGSGSGSAGVSSPLSTCGSLFGLSFGSQNHFFSTADSSAALPSASCPCGLSYTVKLDVLSPISVVAVTGVLDDISESGPASVEVQLGGADSTTGPFSSTVSSNDRPL
jgi:hypothetical protein